MREWGRHEERRMDMITSWKLRVEAKTWEAGGRQGARGEPEVQTKTTSPVTEFIVWAGKKRPNRPNKGNLVSRRFRRTRVFFYF